MSELKIKVTWNGMTVELEGEAENVKEIFNSLKDSGMGRMDECDRKVVSMHTDNMKEGYSDMMLKKFLGQTSNVTDIYTHPGGEKYRENK